MTWTYGLNTTSGCNRAIIWGGLDVPDGASGASLVMAAASTLDAYVGRPGYTQDKVSTDLAEYAYLGANTAVAMFYNEPKSGTGTWLYGGGGSADYDTYMDPLNRPTLVKWSPGIGNNPGFINLDLTYDIQGNTTQLIDNVLMDANATPKRSFDALTSFDSLRRINERDEGQVISNAIASGDRKRREIVPRNLAGRILEDKVDVNWDGSYVDAPAAIDAGNMDDVRTYDTRNRLATRSYNDFVHPSTPATPTITYDANGNLTSDGEKYDYVYNPFNQLVQIYDRVHSSVAANYTYNGLGQRISEQLDTNDSSNTGNADRAVDSHDPVFYIALDQYGRRVATFRNTDTYPKETFFYHPDGVAGPAFKGGLQLRDRDAALSDPTKWATTAASSTRAERFYYCADHQGNVACLVDSSGNIEEQYRYSQSGVPYGIPKGNVDSTGTVTGTMGGADYTIVNYDKTNSVYEARADLNLDGVIDSSDLAIVSAANGHIAGRGSSSLPAIQNHKCLKQSDVFSNGLHTIILARYVFWDSGIGIRNHPNATLTNVDFSIINGSCNSCSKSSTTKSTVLTEYPWWCDVEFPNIADCSTMYHADVCLALGTTCGQCCVNRSIDMLTCFWCNGAPVGNPSDAFTICQNFRDSCIQACQNNATPITRPDPINPGREPIDDPGIIPPDNGPAAGGCLRAQTAIQNGDSCNGTRMVAGLKCPNEVIPMMQTVCVSCSGNCQSFTPRQVIEDGLNGCKIYSTKCE